MQKRLSAKGFTTPFEVYGSRDVILKLNDNKLWEKKVLFQLSENIKKLPADYFDDDAMSENSVQKRISDVENHQ